MPRINSITSMPEFPDMGCETRHIEGFPGYAATVDGRILSCVSRGGLHPFCRRWKLLRCSHTSKGYLSVKTRCKGAAQRRVLVHHLILFAFHGPRPEGLVCRHLDGNPRNNAANNLQWGTSSENQLDRTRHGRSGQNSGERHGMSQLSDADAIRIVEMSVSVPIADLSRQFKINKQVISRIVRGITRWRSTREMRTRLYGQHAPEYKVGRGFVRSDGTCKRETAYAAKLTHAAVDELRASSGLSARELSAKFGISESQVRNILSGRQWAKSR